MLYLQLLRPIYKQIAENQNAEIFSANTLLVILGTSLLTARVSGIILYLITYAAMRVITSMMMFLLLSTIKTGWPFNGTGSIFGWFATC